MKKQLTDDITNTLREMRAEYWRSIEENQATADVEIRDYVVIRLGGERFGLLSAMTREVLRMPRLVRVPRVAEHIPGVINLRGEIVAVTDLRALLGLPIKELPLGGRLIVAESAGLLTALVAEEVEGIRSVVADAIEPLTKGPGDFLRETAEGRVVDDEGMLVLLDLAKILARPEFVIDQKGE